VKKGKRIPAYSASPVSWVALRVVILREVYEWEASMTCSTPGHISGHSTRCHLPGVSGKRWISWCPKAEGGVHNEATFYHCCLIWPCAAGVPVVFFHVTIVRNVIRHDLLSQGVLHTTTGTRDLLRQQDDKPNVI
jgi:hypothetical protein